jgi:hypothetical protein
MRPKLTLSYAAPVLGPTQNGFVDDSPCGSSPSRAVNIETSIAASEKAVASSIMHGIMAR